METNRSVIQGVREIIGKNTSRLSNENTHPSRLVFFYLKLFRSRLLKQKRNLQRSMHDLLTLSCVELEQTDYDNCFNDGCTPPTGIIVMRSKLNMPRPLFSTYESVMTSGGEQSLSYIKYNDLKDIWNSRYKTEREKMYYTIVSTNDKTKLVVVNTKWLQYLSVADYFDDIEEYQRFPGCNQKVKMICDMFAEEFKCDSDILQVVIQMTAEFLIKYKQGSPMDIIEDDLAGNTPILK